MSISMKEATAISAIADLLYDFLPGSGNSSTAFPLAADEVGGWRVLAARQQTFHRWFSFSPASWSSGGINAIVRQSLTWRRGRGEPLMREEIEHLNFR